MHIKRENAITGTNLCALLLNVYLIYIPTIIAFKTSIIDRHTVVSHFVHLFIGGTIIAMHIKYITFVTDIAEFSFVLTVSLFHDSNI